MNKYIVRSGVDPTDIRGFSEASREELRVLLALSYSKNGLDEVGVSEKAQVSRARAAGALAFWEAEGIIEQLNDGKAPTISEEFAERVEIGELDEITAEEAARCIRDEGLAELLSECASLMNKPALSTSEVKIITALADQYALTADYILTLAAYLQADSRFTAQRLRDQAIRLVGKGIDTTEALEVFIKDKENEIADAQELRRIFGIWGRSFSDSERECFKRWGEEFGYSTVIIGEAYNICVMNTGRFSAGYMDKILTAWHEGGCKTLEECRAFSAQAKVSAKKSEAPARKRTKSEVEKPRYGDFDVSDAFAKALERSYGDEN